MQPEQEHCELARIEREAFDAMVRGLGSAPGPFLVVDADGNDVLVSRDPYMQPAPGRWARVVNHFRGQA